MESEGSLLHLQVPATCPYVPILSQFNLVHAPPPPLSEDPS